MSKIRKFSLVPIPPPSAEDHARGETERNTDLFKWADRLLAQLGVMQAIAAANTIEELRKVVFDADCAEAALAIRDALHPVSEQTAVHFHHLKEGGLKRILRMRFIEAKKDRAAALGRGAGGAQAVPDWAADLILDKNDAIRPVLANLTLFLRFHPEWEDVLGFDEFCVRVVIRKPPPWEQGAQEASDAPWIDHHESQTRIWFQHEGLFANLGDVGRAVQAAARHNSFHPVRDYFNSLEWDGTPRLDTWLQDFFHVEDSDYVRAIGPRYLISAAARIYRPGCQADHTLILEGTQGRLKSEALRTLAVHDEWFTDRLSHISSKDAAQETTGVLFIELAELDALMRAASSASKSFLTRRYERIRLPYGRHLVRLPRQCVFAGTINPPTTGYLRDATGNRRFWPVTCRGQIDRDGLEHNRSQIWAEAVHRYRRGATWWLETPELEMLATVEQTARLIVDVWKEAIETWLDENRRDDVSLTEILRDALGLQQTEQTQRAMNRVSAILTALGFSRRRAREGIRSENKRPIRYRRER